MARARLFHLVQRMVQAAVNEAVAANPKAMRYTRRDVLRLGAAGAGALAASSLLKYSHAQALEIKPLTSDIRIGIVGAGLAGLTAAYRLFQLGIQPDVFEAANRTGGRVMTRRGFNADGMFCEMGGELVDSGHADLKNLCAELGLALQPLKENQAGEELYYFSGQFLRKKDLIGEGGQGGAFSALAAKIAEDRLSLENDGNWTDRAHELDRTSLNDYLQQCASLAPGWVMSLLDVAYTVEYGLPTSEQSALNLLQLISTDTRDDFSLYGESDEAWRVEGGSSKLVEGLLAAVNGHADIKRGHKLIALAKNSRGAILCRFDAGRGKPLEREYDRVILTLPFTMLRQVEGLDALGLSPLKLQAIRELGYGANGKVIFGFTEASWKKRGPEGLASNGEFFTDLSSQCTWDCSRGQKGESGILVNYLGGKQGEAPPAERVAAAREDLPRLIPDFENTEDKRRMVYYFWNKHPYSLGSYSCPKPGQVTTLVPACATPELDGALLFAGEHTSADFGGYMNGAIESANRAAREVAESITDAARAMEKKEAA